MVQNFRKGFSLVELLVVIAIIGILAAVGITAYSGYTSSAKEKATLANHAQVLKFINAEMAKCAGGEGNFVWGAPDPCTRTTASGNSTGIVIAYVVNNANHGSIANYVNVTLGMTNPYDVTQGAAAVAGVVHGTMVIACGGTNCTVTTYHAGDAGNTGAIAVPYM